MGFRDLSLGFCMCLFGYVAHTMKKGNATNLPLLPLISHNDFVTFVLCISLRPYKNPEPKIGEEEAHRVH
ncbi:hypothetical protein KSMBR1_2345 [Candidatus Kuenenia stuttgartiensis]|uniref:Uncharacterized protein n=1 Tax=Kuenenia stuttgartiensis TaxID=174633 RepID=A0A2C9CGN4_KUEST|nr:hypothetical protein KSMBR1_2345 [Candidatus Kuenenia stuttgartiensis]